MKYTNITTKDDYKEIYGLDLDIELGAAPNDTAETASNVSIHNVESYFSMYFSLYYDFHGDLTKLTEHQKKCFKYAVCYQLEYVINSGTLNHSGVDPTKGVFITRADLEKVKVSSDAEMWMQKGGMRNLKRGASAKVSNDALYWVSGDITNPSEV